MLRIVVGNGLRAVPSAQRPPTDKPERPVEWHNVRRHPTIQPGTDGIEDVERHTGRSLRYHSGLYGFILRDTAHHIAKSLFPGAEMAFYS